MSLTSYTTLATFNSSTVLGLGDGSSAPDFWLSSTNFANEKIPVVTGPIHLAFKAKTKEQVDAFYEAAVKAGGKGNGEPGLREHYGEGYYAAFVVDGEGRNVECVVRGWKEEKKDV